MNDPRIFENPCAICKVRVAEKLCDYVIRYDNSIIFYRNLQRFIRENSSRHETCDLPLCNKCAIEIGVNVDFCPHHYKLHLQSELPERLKKYQLKQKAKQAAEEWERVNSSDK